MHHWESAALRELLSASIAPYVVGGTERVILRGDEVVLRPRAVLTLAMAFHELTTNAAKYGALSVPGGRIEIHWYSPRNGDDGHPLLRIVWVEQGGPPVAGPHARGFGSRLIEGSIAAELGGRAKLEFEPTGVRCEINVPLTAVAIDTRPEEAAQP
jgi:two-component sensor histidine kinase